MTDITPPPLPGEKPPIQVMPSRVAPSRPVFYPQVFPAARWRLAVGIWGCVFLAPIAFFLVKLGGFGGGYVVCYLFAAGLLYAMVYGLLETRVEWTLYEDRLEYRTPLGRMKTVRRSDVVSFKCDFTGGKWTLRDARTKILISWGAERWTDLRDILKTWAPPSR
jgi:hypothetical protein